MGLSPTCKSRGLGDAEEDVFFVQSHYCSMCYINDGIYFLRDSALKPRCVRNVRENNVDSFQIYSPNVRADFHSHKLWSSKLHGTLMLANRYMAATATPIT